MRQGFEDWMKRVDATIARRLDGLASNDLPDVDYWGMYEARLLPSDAASYAIRDSGITLGVW